MFPGALVLCRGVEKLVASLRNNALGIDMAEAFPPALLSFVGKRPRITRTRQRLTLSCAVRILGSSLGGRPVVRQKLGNPGNGMIGDAGENIFEPDERVDSDALTGSHETP